MSEDENDWPAADDVLVLAAMRGDRDERIVARVQFTDVTGEYRNIDLTPTIALDLLVQLAQFVRQIGITD